MLMTKMMKDLKDSIEGGDKKAKRGHTHVHKRSPTRKPRDYRERNTDDKNNYGR